MKKASIGRPTLAVGMIVRVHGFVMLQGLDDGVNYRVVAIDDEYGGAITLRRVRGRKLVRHRYSDVWLAMRPGNVSTDLNWIEVL